MTYICKGLEKYVWEVLIDVIVERTKNNGTQVQLELNLFFCLWKTKTKTILIRDSRLGRNKYFIGGYDVFFLEGKAKISLTPSAIE